MADQQHASIRPRSFTEYDAGLDCYVSRVVGYYASCPCGWRSAPLVTFAAARGRLRVHRAEAGHEKARQKPVEPR